MQVETVALPARTNAEAVSDPAELAAIWGRVRERLRTELTPEIFSTWFERLALDAIAGETAQLSAPTRFLKSWLEQHYRARIRDAVAAECAAVRIAIEVRRIDRRAPRQAPAAPQRADIAKTPDPPTTRPELPTTQVAGSSPLNPEFRFHLFLADDGNRFALAAAQELARHRRGQRCDYSPSLLYGGFGRGKTHLLQAMAWAAAETGGAALYLTAERVLYCLAQARSPADLIGAADLLLLDDVHFVQGARGQALGQIVRAALNSGCVVALAANRPLIELDGLDAGLRDRLAGGLAVEIGAPARDTRIAILRRRIEQRGSLQVDEGAIAYIADAFPHGGRDLEGAVNRLALMVSVTGRAVDRATAETAVRDLVRPPEPPRIAIEAIQRVVADHFQISRADMLSSRRTASVVRPRQIAMYLAKTLTPRSLPEIGRRFGGRDHTTVLHAVRKLEQLCSQEPAFAAEIADLKQRLQAC